MLSGFVRHLLVSSLLATSTPALGATAGTPGSGEITLASWHCLSPDGSKVVFEWRDDLWSVGIDGGRATRLTAHPARDSYPMFSPDGSTLLFCSTREGVLQLFSMPAGGGPATQHTFHSEGANLESISPDGTTALVRGKRDAPGFRPWRLIEINLQREAPESYLFDATGHSASYSPDGSRVLFCREGEQLYRKGYRGPRASSIWLHDVASGSFVPVVKEEIEARSPVWQPDGAGFYYVSERDGCFNLWQRELGTGADRQVTDFEGDGVVRPTISRDGGTIVFRRGFHLWRLRTTDGAEPERIDIHQREDLADTSSELRKITGTVDCDFSASGLEIVFKAEGELWAMDTVLREPNRITRTPGNEDDPVFSKDGRHVYFHYDDGIEANIWRLSRRDDEEFWWRADSFEREQVTHGPEAKSRFQLSPDGSHLAWVAGSGKLTVARADGSEPRVLFSCWNPPTYDWSPDGQWIVFAAQDQNFNRDIYIVPVDGSREPFNVSRHPDFEGSPRWSPDGRRIAFTGRRLNNEMGLFFVDLRLREAVRSSRDRKELEAEEMMREDPLYQEHETSEGDDEPDDEPDDGASEMLDLPEREEPLDVRPPRSRLQIDFAGLSDRIVRLNTRGIEPERVIWSHDSESLLFQSKNSNNEKLYRIEASRKGDMTVVAKHRGLPIRVDRDGTLYWIVSRDPSILRKGKLSSFRIRARMERDRVAHQRLCYRLVWRTLRDRFYDEHLNGLDWKRMLAKYEEAAATAPDSASFDVIVSMLLGELNASHLSFDSEVWPRPWENEGAEFQHTRHVGIRFARSGPGDPLTVAHVIADSPAANASPPIREGDTIVKVNGRRVDGSTPVHRFMNGRLDRDIELVVRDAEGRTHGHRLEPITYNKATLLAEDEMISNNRLRVEELSGGRLGYIHIERMNWDEFEQFERQIYAAGHGKEGLVIDIRDNGGGTITDHLLTVLCQPRHAVTIPRDGGPGYPQDRKVYASWHKPLVVLCNQNSYSNAEIFAHAIKTLDRGKIVGVQTAGGVISAGKDRILDAGTLRVPFRGWFLASSGEDMEMNGAMPDHVVWPHPGQLIQGEDPQLAKAVEVLLADVESVERKPFKANYSGRK